MNRGYFLRFVAAVAVALGAHLLLGWVWSISGGVLIGWMSLSGGWWKGAVAVGTAWATLLAYNMIVAPGPVTEMHRLVASIAGDFPPWSAPAATLAIGIVIGLSGGIFGRGARDVFRDFRSRRTDAT